MKIESIFTNKNSLLFAGIGFFTLGSQTLIFRASLRVFEGSEICTGLFLFTWLFWAAAGAAFYRLIPESFRSKCTPVILSLLFPLACLLQMLLLIRARSVWGIPEYEIFTLGKLTLTMFLFNAPVSLLTGFIFAITSRLTAAGDLYRCEALGSFIGCVIITWLLYIGVSDATVFSVLTCLLLLLLHPAFPKKLQYIIPVYVFLITAAIGGGLLLHHEFKASWQRFLPNTRIQGTFMTSQAAYTYGIRDGSFVVSRWNSICTALPGRPWLNAALCMAQKPDAKSIMIIGDNAPLALAFCKLKQVSRVCWVSPDPNYPQELFSIVPESYSKPEKLVLESITVMQKRDKIQYDLVIVQPPALTSLSTNRFYSQEFFRLIRSKLLQNGVMAISFSGGENFLSLEQKHFGASLLVTLSTVFKQLILRPGEHSWFFATEASGIVTGKDEVMEQRLKQIPDLKTHFPPEGIYTVFESFRAQMQLQEYYDYLKANRKEISLNTAYSPRLFLDSVINYLKRLELNVPNDLVLRLRSIFFYAGFILFPLLFGIEYILKRTTGKFCTEANSGAAMLVVFLTSISAMVWCLSAMFIFQMRFGSLFLWFGMLNASFMLGLFLGGSFARKKGKSSSFALAGITFAVVLTITLSITGFALCPILFSFLFVASGFAAGLFLPLGEKILGEKQGGALLEALDCSGGAIGAILAGILLVPLFGPLKAVLIGLPLVLVWSIRQWTPCRVSLRTFGTVIFIVGLTLWLLLTIPTNAADIKLSSSQIKSLGLSGLKTKSETVKGKSVLELTSSNGITQGWIFRSRDFFKEHPDGYEGPIYLLIRISPDGTIKNLDITSHHENSRYLKRALRCKSKLIGTTVSTNGKLPEIDAVTGATFSSQAIIETALKATRNFVIATNIKSQPPATKTPAKKQAAEIPDESNAPPLATVRKIDEKKYKQLIKQGKLSNHKALFQSPQNK